MCAALGDTQIHNYELWVLSSELSAITSYTVTDTQTFARKAQIFYGEWSFYTWVEGGVMWFAFGCHSRA